MFFSPKILEEADSKFSGRLRVMHSWGSHYIATGPLTQTGGLVKEVWEGVLKKYGRKNSSWLILGLAGGTIAGIISRHLSPAKITGIEIDPVIIDLGRKYLGLGDIPHLEIEIKDAQDYVLHLLLHFDFILVDMYLGDRLPDFVYDLQFLKKLKVLGGCVIFNHLFYDDTKRRKAGELVESLKQIFPSVTLARKLTNLLIICS
jgi:spermidine synthase